MAKYRQVHTTFWDDGFVIDLTPEEKYFYLYLMTNNNTTQCGIYELPYRVIEMQTGYNRDTVLKLLARFKEYGKILYHEPTKEIILLNWARYNFINSPSVRKCIEKELKLVKHLPFVETYLTTLTEYGHRIDTLSIPSMEPSASKVTESSNGEGSIPYGHRIDSPYIDHGEEEEKEEEKEQEKEREEEQKEEGATLAPPLPSLSDQSFLKIKSYFEQHIRIATFRDAQDINKLLDFYLDADLILEAMKIALERSKPHLNYVDGILKRWSTEQGINTYQDFLMKGGQQHGGNQRSNASHIGKTPEEIAMLERLRTYSSNPIK